jgi:hypothetical protein
MTLISKYDDGKEFDAPFTEEENTKLMKVAKDFDIGMVYCKGYSSLWPKMAFPFHLILLNLLMNIFCALDDKLDNLCFFVDDKLILSFVH